MAFLVNLIPDLRSWFRPELRAGPRARIGLGRGRGAATGSTGSAVAWLLVEGGDGQVQAGSTTVEVGGRSDVFDGPGWSLLIPPKTPIATRGPLRYTVIARAWDGPVELRVFSPDEVTEESYGPLKALCEQAVAAVEFTRRKALLHNGTNKIIIAAAFL